MTEKQIHWLGEFAQSLIFAVSLYVVVRLVDGPSHKPTIAMPFGLRLIVLGAVLVCFATLRTWRYYRKRR